MTLVVILTVRCMAIEAFWAFETQAAAIMTGHGGAIERTIVMPPSDETGCFQEVHIVTFPDEAAFTAYRVDPALRAVAHLRGEAVVSTEVLMGVDGPTYGDSAPQGRKRPNRRPLPS